MKKKKSGKIPQKLESVVLSYFVWVTNIQCENNFFMIKNMFIKHINKENGKCNLIRAHSALENKNRGKIQQRLESVVLSYFI